MSVIVGSSASLEVTSGTTSAGLVVSGGSVTVDNGAVLSGATVVAGGTITDDQGMVSDTTVGASGTLVLSNAEAPHRHYQTATGRRSLKFRRILSKRPGPAPGAVSNGTASLTAVGGVGSER